MTEWVRIKWKALIYHLCVPGVAGRSGSTQGIPQTLSVGDCVVTLNHGMSEQGKFVLFSLVFVISISPYMSFCHFVALTVAFMYRPWANMHCAIIDFHIQQMQMLESSSCYRYTFTDSWVRSQPFNEPTTNEGRLSLFFSCNIMSPNTFADKSSNPFGCKMVHWVQCHCFLQLWKVC